MKPPRTTGGDKAMNSAENEKADAQIRRYEISDTQEAWVDVGDRVCFTSPSGWRIEHQIERAGYYRTGWNGGTVDGPKRPMTVQVTWVTANGSSGRNLYDVNAFAPWDAWARARDIAFIKDVPKGAEVRFFVTHQADPIPRR